MWDKADKKRALERNAGFADGGTAESVIAGMVGGGYYNQHSARQMASIDFVLPWLDAAIASMPLSEDWPTTIGLADFGCSEGGNSIAVTQRLVSAFRKRSSRPIQSHHIDLPTNDYRELFKNLRPDGRPVFEAAKTYSAAVGGSMYDQLLPPALHPSCDHIQLDCLPEQTTGRPPRQLCIGQWSERAAWHRRGD